MSKSQYNNSNVSLAAGQQFTGIGESTGTYVEISVSIKSDRDATVHVEQSADKLNWDIRSTHAYKASQGGTSIAVGSKHQWFRVIVLNSSGSAQSYMRMTTYKLEEFSSAVSVGTDGDGVKRNILVDSDGKLSVSLSGTVGPAGQSAYQLAVAEGFTGDETAWLASLVGATGPAGATGATGATGAQGIAGVAGTNGTNGTNGIDGAEGQRGLPGINGSNGIDIKVKGTLTTAQIIALPEAGLLVNDAYFSSDEFKLYVFSGVQWVASESLRGPAGAVGSVGPAGVAGDSVLVLGTLASAALLPLNAMVGHAYFLSDTFELAVSRGPTLWTFSDSLRGATGATGATGAVGATGEVGAGVVARGSVADLTALNAIINMTVGDLYIVESDYKMYIWNGTLWRSSGVSMRGPQGEQGIQGLQGTVGSVGARGFSIVVGGNVANSSALPTGYNGDDIGKTWFVNDIYSMAVWDGTAFQYSASLRGATGEPGIQGQVGETGYSIIVLGQVADSAELATVSAGFGFTDTGKTYVKLDSYSYEVWNGVTFVSSGNLRGAPGANGADGADGADGTNAINLQVLGSVADAAALAAVSAGWTNQQINQAYFQDDNFTLNIWNGTSFVSSGSLRGEQGVQGVQGETGATGPTGATGEIGPQGPAGVMPAPTIISYEVSSGTGGGTGTAATWNIRPLNSIFNSGGNGGIGLSANKIVFTTAGTYKVEFTGAVFDAGLHKSRLRNITTATTLGVGMSGHCSNANDGHSEGVKVITVAANDEVELQHWLSINTTNNLGDPVSSGELELYARVVIERLS